MYKNFLFKDAIVTNYGMNMVLNATDRMQFTKISSTYAKINSDWKLVANHNSITIPPDYPQGFQTSYKMQIKIWN